MRPLALLRVLLLNVMLVCPVVHAGDTRVLWQRAQGGYLRRWLVLGELPNGDRKSLDTDFLAALGGEAAIRPKAGMQSQRPDGSPIAWKEIESESHVVDLMRVFAGRPLTEVAACAYTVIERPATWWRL